MNSAVSKDEKNECDGDASKHIHCLPTFGQRRNTSNGVGTKNFIYPKWGIDGAAAKVQNVFYIRNATIWVAT
jgi:hypothetical protein